MKFMNLKNNLILVTFRSQEDKKRYKFIDQSLILFKNERFQSNFMLKTILKRVLL
jgi:hypothetical protein